MTGEEASGLQALPLMDRWVQGDYPLSPSAQQRPAR